MERLLDLSLENILILRSPDSDEAVVFCVVLTSVSISSRTFVQDRYADVVGGVLVDGVVWVLG